MTDEKTIEEEAAEILDEMDSQQEEVYDRPVSADYEPEPHEEMYKDREHGWFVMGRKSDSRTPSSHRRSNTEDYFEIEGERDTHKEADDPSEVYDNWVSETTNETEPREEDTTSQESNPVDRQTSPAERIEQFAKPSTEPTPSSRTIGVHTKTHTTNDRRQAIDDDQESSSSSSGYISPAMTQFDPETDGNGNRLSHSAQEKYKRLKKHHDSRKSGYNDTGNAITKVRESKRIGATLEISDYQQKVLTNIMIELDMDEFGSFNTSQVVVFAAFALLQNEYRRHHFSYESGDEQYPDPDAEDTDILSAAEILNLENHKDDFESIIESENNAINENAPEITKSIIKEQSRKIQNQGVVPSPEY